MIRMEMTAVYGGGKENKEWSRLTPFGTITMNITNPEAFDLFVSGQEVYVDFTNANNGDGT